MTDPVIITESLTRRFGEIVAVDGLSMEVFAGEIFGFLGHNGAGKTTTVRLLNGVLSTSGGRATVLGLSPQGDGPALRRRTGVLTETPSLDERLTARENLSIYADLYDVPVREVSGRVEEYLAMFELADRADEKVGGYSKGMKQRLALARSLLHNPEIIFLDEPTSGLDPVTTRHVHQMIEHMSAEEGRTVFLCTHNLVEAQSLCDRVAVLERGRLIALGTPTELAEQTVHTHRLKIEVALENRQTAVQLLKGRTGITGVSEEKDGLIVQGAGRETIPSLIADLVSSGVRIYQVTPQEPSLEDVYFALHHEEGIPA
ncbi:MAG: ABC transporter ATP-binding protein [Anaerolineales bacterium]|jgi:ABC-2 type transport system ATP-binding protein